MPVIQRARWPPSLVLQPRKGAERLLAVGEEVGIDATNNVAANPAVGASNRAKELARPGLLDVGDWRPGHHHGCVHFREIEIDSWY